MASDVSKRDCSGSVRTKSGSLQTCPAQFGRLGQIGTRPFGGCLSMSHSQRWPDSCTEGQRMTILVVDDDADLRRGLRALLEARGLEVVEAATIRQADVLAQLYEPATLLVDGILPDGNGVEWISMLRSEGREANVVFMSSFLAKGNWLTVLSKLGVRHRINKRETSIGEIADIVARETRTRSRP